MPRPSGLSPPGRSRRRCAESRHGYRQILFETYYRGRSCAEVATELGVSEMTVRNRVHDGLQAMKKVGIGR